MAKKKPEEKRELVEFQPFEASYLDIFTEKLWEVVFPQEMAAAFQGEIEAQSALDLLYKPSPAVVTGGLSFDLLHQFAMGYAEHQAGTLIKGITDDLVKYVQSETSQWIQSGDPLQALEDRLALKFSPERAELIASTEVTKAYAEGNLLIWRNEAYAGSIKGRRWMTAVDELVCDICGPRDQQMVGGLDGGWEDFDDQPIDGPPAHPRCRCYLLPVVPGSSMRTTSVPPDPINPSDPWPPKMDRATKNPRTVPSDIIRQGREFIKRGDDVESYSARGASKDKLIQELSSRTKVSYTALNDFVHQWANTSNDNAYASLQIQARTAKVLGTKLSPWQEQRMADELIIRSRGGKIPRQSLSIFEKSDMTLWDEFLVLGYQNSDEVVDDVIKAMYQYTQEELKAAGITQVHVWRGVSVDPTLHSAIANSPNKMMLGIDEVANAAESWTVEASIAERFAGYNGVVMEAIMPANRVIGTARTGFGCLNEWEFVISGGTVDDLITATVR